MFEKCGSLRVLCSPCSLTVITRDLSARVFKDSFYKVDRVSTDLYISMYFRVRADASVEKDNNNNLIRLERGQVASCFHEFSMADRPMKFADNRNNRVFICLRCLYVIGNTPKCYNAARRAAWFTNNARLGWLRGFMPIFLCISATSFMHVPFVSDYKSHIRRCL